MPSTSFYNEDGGYDYENTDIYLPLNLSGRITLVGNGDSGNALNLPPYDPQIFPTPKALSIPTQQLLVELTKSGKGIIDNNGEAVTDKNGSFQYKNEQVKATYYQWDGLKLKKIKSEIL